MVIFHSYVSLPEGNHDVPKKKVLTIDFPRFCDPCYFSLRRKKHAGHSASNGPILWKMDPTFPTCR